MASLGVGGEIQDSVMASREEGEHRSGDKTGQEMANDRGPGVG